MGHINEQLDFEKKTVRKLTLSRIQIVVMVSSVLLLTCKEEPEEHCNFFALSVEAATSNCGEEVIAKVIVDPPEDLYLFALKTDKGVRYQYAASFQWDNTTPVREFFYSLPPGTYEAFALNTEKGCGKTQRFIVSQAFSASLKMEATVVTQKNCGAQPGSITVSIEGGTPPFQVTVGFQEAVRLSENRFYFESNAGNYIFRVVDSKGCELTKEIELLAEDVINFETELTNSYSNCASGSIRVKNITGGQPPYKITVSHCVKTHPYSGQCEASFFDQNRSTNTHLTSLQGKYTITVSDSESCVSTKTITIPNDGNTSTLFFSISASDDMVSCAIHTGQIKIAASGGVPPYQYQLAKMVNSGVIPQPPIIIFPWDSIPTYSNLPAEWYLVSLKDATGCLLGKSIHVLSGPVTLSLTHASIPNTNCLSPNGSLTISPEGGEPPYSFQIAFNNPTSIVAPWSSSLTYANLNDASYDVSIKDALGCMTTKIIEIPHGNTNVSYVTDVQLLFTTHCNNTGCHDSSLGATLDFRDRLIVKSKGTEIMTRIANRSMPPIGNPISVPLGDDQIKLITCWIKDGSPNN